MELSYVPEPILRIDFFMYSAITGEIFDLTPTTQAEFYLDAIAKNDLSVLDFANPRTILDTYLHSLVSGDISDLPKPRTVSEMILYQSVTGEDLGVEPVSRMDKYLSQLRKRQICDNQHTNIVGQAIVGYARL